ncbi:MAG: hypothetical protein JXR20_02820 [Balneola sp.]
MHFIPPAEISGKIMTLIDQAKKELIIVSPYNKVTNWDKLIKRLNKARNRGVKITWYIRSRVKNNEEQIRSLGIEPIAIDNLHAKLYLNENDAVVTSMNLSEYSDTSSIDIGYHISETKEYSKLTKFIEDHLAINNNEKHYVSSASKADGISNFYQLIIEYLSKDCGFEKEINSFKGRYGKVIELDPFIGNTELYFEPRGTYYRIDLKTRGKNKSALYNFLVQEQYFLEKEIGEPINYGSQMKRLKIDLEIFEHYEYEKWGEKEFKIIIPHIDKIISVYKNYLKKIVN